MAYATVSKAYKAGTYSYTIQSWTEANNATGENQSAVIEPIPPEEVQNFEVGSRMMLFGSRVRFNPTLFYMKYTNRQAARQVPCTPPGVGSCPNVGFSIQVVDSGDVDIWGGELDMQIAVTDELTIDAFGRDPRLRDQGSGGEQRAQPVPRRAVAVVQHRRSPTAPISTSARRPSISTTPMSASRRPIRPRWAIPPSGWTTTESSTRASGSCRTTARCRSRCSPTTCSTRLSATYAQRFGGGFWDAGSGVGPAEPPRSALGEVMGRPREVGLTVQYGF